MKDLVAGSNAGVEILVLKIQCESELRRVKPYGFGQVGSSELGNCAGYSHLLFFVLFSDYYDQFSARRFLKLYCEIFRGLGVF